MQFLGTAVAWLLHAFIAGPARDNRIRDVWRATRALAMSGPAAAMSTFSCSNPDDWVTIAPERKRVLGAVMAERPTSMSFSQIWQYLVKGVSSTDDMVRVAHLLAQDIRSDWRRFSPDAHYKIGKATQVTGMGSSSFPFLVGSLFRIIEAVGGHVPLGWKIGLSAGPLAVYVLGGERYSGELVNEVIAMRQKMMAKYPYGRAPSGHRRLRDLRTFGSNFVLVPKAFYQDVTRRYGSVQAKNAIEAARTKAQQLAQPDGNVSV